MNPNCPLAHFDFLLERGKPCRVGAQFIARLLREEQSPDESGSYGVMIGFANLMDNTA